MTRDKILIVEDDKNISKLVRYNLEKAGFDCESTITGEDALLALDKHAFDLIVLDIMLPKIDGLQILRTLKEKKIKNGPIILLTNLGQDSIVKDGFKAGAAGYLIKSAMSPDQVLHEVRVFLNKSREDK